MFGFMSYEGLNLKTERSDLLLSGFMIYKHFFSPKFKSQYLFSAIEVFIFEFFQLKNEVGKMPNSRCIVCGHHIESWMDPKEVVINEDGAFHKECYRIHREEERNNKIMEAII